MSARRALCLAALLGACSPEPVRLRDFTIVQRFMLTGAGRAYRVAISGNTAFVSDDAGFHAIDLGGDDGTGAADVAAYEVQPPTSQLDQQLALRGTTLAVAHGSRIALVDVSTPSAPVTLSTIEATSAVVAVAFDEHWLYWGGENLYRADISDLAHPGPPSAVIYSGAVSLLLAADDVLYVAAPGTLTVLQRPNPEIVNPAAVPLATVPVGGNTGDLLRVGDMLYGASGTAGQLWVADVHDPSAPVVVTPAPAGLGEAGCQFAVFPDDQLLLPDAHGVTSSYDISTPSAPKLLESRSIARGYDGFSCYGSGASGERLVITLDAGVLLLAPTLAE